MTPLQSKPIPVPPIQLDWVAYFAEFSRVHGGNPLLVGGRLLFQDGWAYSATDHAGPEWSPPADPVELRQLLEMYWRRRFQVVTDEHRRLTQDLRALEAMQRQRLVPMQQVQWSVGEDGRMRVSRGNLDLSGMRGRLEWLAQDVRECSERLLELSGRSVA